MCNLCTNPSVILIKLQRLRNLVRNFAPLLTPRRSVCVLIVIAKDGNFLKRLVAVEFVVDRKNKLVCRVVSALIYFRIRKQVSLLQLLFQAEAMYAFKLAYHQ